MGKLQHHLLMQTCSFLLIGSYSLLLMPEFRSKCLEPDSPKRKKRSKEYLTVIESDSLYKIMGNVHSKEADNCTSILHRIHKWSSGGQKVEAKQLS